jgi:hypothetical protein
VTISWPTSENSVAMTIPTTVLVTHGDAT